MQKFCEEMENNMERARKSISMFIMLIFVTLFASMSSDIATAKADTDEFSARLMYKQLTVVVGYKNEIIIKNSCEDAKYSFTSSNNKVAKVNKFGMISGISKGTATITVTERLDGVTRTLGKVKVKAIERYLDKEFNIPYSEGGVFEVFPIHNYEDDAIYTIKSSDPKTVSVSGRYYLYAHKLGSVYISVTENYKGKVTNLGKTKVNVVKPQAPKKVQLALEGNIGPYDLVLYPNYFRNYKYISENKDIVEINEKTGDFNLKNYGSAKVNIYEINNGKSKKIGTTMVEVIPTTFDKNYDYQKIEVYKRKDITFFKNALDNLNEQATFSFEAGDSNIISVTSKEKKDKKGTKSKHYYFEGVQPGRTTLKIYEEFKGDKRLVATAHIMVTEPDLIFRFNESDYGPCDQDGIFNTTMDLNDYDNREIIGGLEKYPYEDLTYVTYTSSDEQVVKIDKKGEIALISEGTAIITASYGGITTKLRIKVEKDEYEEYEY